MESLDIRTAITVGGVIFAALSAWFAVKFGQESNQKNIKSLKNNIEKLQQELNAGLERVTRTDGQQWAKLDEIAQRTANVETLTHRHEAVLDPAMIGDYREERAKMEKDLEYLRRDLDRMLKKE